jgi:hypothetical protein
LNDFLQHDSSSSASLHCRNLAQVWQRLPPHP